jgi:threonine dehydrogenase-like Zn-dependent dehydrogenase
MRPASDQRRARSRARIGIIGAGWWATYAHLPSLSTYPSAEVVAIADMSPERLADAAERFGVAAQFADYREMLDRGDLDGVVVATPHASHYAIATDVLQRGIGLMLEKPMVLRAREARNLVQLAEQQGVPLVVGYTISSISWRDSAPASPKVLWARSSSRIRCSRRWCSSITAPIRKPTRTSSSGR